MEEPDTIGLYHRQASTTYCCHPPNSSLRRSAMAESALQFQQIVTAMPPWQALLVWKNRGPVDAAELQWNIQSCAVAKYGLHQMVRGKSPGRKRELITEARQLLRAALHIQRAELLRIPELAVADVDWAMLRACEAMGSGMETRLSLDSEFENFPAAHNRPYMHIKYRPPKK